MNFLKLETWKQKARILHQEVYAIYLAYKDPRVPWYARFLAALIVGYAFSPIDLIPEVIPVIGYLDDLILIPLGIRLVAKMIPPEVLQECRETARKRLKTDRPKNWIAGSIILLIWVAIFAAVAVYLSRFV